MDKKQKVWIRGCEGRGTEVIQKLVVLGGKDLSVALKYLALNPSLIFFITNFEKIAYTDDNTELARIIMEEYTEIKLDEKAEDKHDNKANEQPEFKVDEKTEDKPKEQPEFKVDDMVLRRAKPGAEWKVFQYWYLLTMGGPYSFEIIPYNEETKHLLNTTGNYER